MKRCSYCGRESAEGATHCGECGTELAVHESPEKPPKYGKWAWVAWVGATVCLGYAAVVAALRYAAVSGSFSSLSGTMFYTANSESFAHVIYAGNAGVLFMTAAALMMTWRGE